MTLPSFTDLRTRLILAFALIIFLTLALVGSGFVYIFRDFQSQREMDRLAGMAVAIQGQLREAEASGVTRDGLIELLRRQSDDLDIGLTLINPAGVVVFDTEGKLEGRRIELGNATRAGPFRRMRVGSLVGDDDLLIVVVSAGAPAGPGVAPPGPAGGSPRERFQLSLGLVAQQQSITSTWVSMTPQLATVAAIALLISTGVAWVLAASIAQPLAAMTRASEEMARGYYEQEIPVRGNDEVGRLARAFNEMAHEVANSHRTLRDFVANVSHDLRTPLTSIQGFAQALMDGAVRGPEGAAQAGRIIYDESDRMRRLVEDLLELSRIESRQIKLEIGPLDLGALAARAQQRLEVQAIERGVRLELDLADAPLASADQRRVEQVLDNLLGNALKFTPRGGVITIRVRPIQQGSSPQVMLAVHNTGSYISPEELSRVFERFYQVDKSRVNVGAGSGLGLAIAREIAQVQGGSLTAVSDVTMGTEFRLTVPTVPVPRVSGASVVRNEAPWLGARRRA